MLLSCALLRAAAKPTAPAKTAAKPTAPAKSAAAKPAAKLLLRLLRLGC